MAVGTVSGIDPADNWQEITATTISSGTASYTYSSLSGYKKIVLFAKNVTLSAEDYPVVRINGVTSAGRYVSLSSNGSFFYIAPSATSGLAFFFTIDNIDKSAPHFVTSTDTSGGGSQGMYTDPVPVTSITILNRDGSTFTSGNIYVYGIAA